MNTVYKDKENCCGCCACEARCPRRAIRMEPDEEGFLYPVIDHERCVGCGICAHVCPLRREGNFKEEGRPRFFAATHRSAEVLRRSTSGGAFTAISDAVIGRGGAVCGAVFDAGLRVAHRIARTAAGRDRMRGSKYVQSDMRGIYDQLREELERGAALFTGTPCQCAGVRSFFEGSPLAANLFACDLICHSVPSPLIWEEYKRLLEAENGGKLAEVFFRSKKYPWLRDNSNRGFLYRLAGAEEFLEDDRFYELFIRKGTISRPSCGRCRFADTRRAADLTIADCFGIEKYAPELYDSRGVSLIIVNTPRGAEMLKDAARDMAITERPAAEITAEQRRLSAPAESPAERGEFWEKVRRSGLKSAL